MKPCLPIALAGVLLSTVASGHPALPTIVVSPSNYVFLQESLIAPIVPSLDGSVTRVSIAPTPGLGSPSGFPAATGLAFDAHTGAISGAPSASGSFYYTLTAHNSIGQTASAAISILVNPIPTTAPPPSTAPGCWYTLSIARFYSTNITVYEPQVYAGTTQILPDSSGLYQIPLTNPDYTPIIDDNSPIPPAVPDGVWEVRRSAGSFVAGNSGHEDHTGLRGYVSYAVAATMSCPINSVTNYKGANGFDRESNGTSKIGDPGDDQYAWSGNSVFAEAIFAESTAATGADLYIVAFSPESDCTAICGTGSTCTPAPGNVICGCAAGSYGSPEIGVAATCTICPAGDYCPEGSITPIACPTDSYCPPASSAPTACPGGYTTCNAGAASATACTPSNPCAATDNCGTITNGCGVAVSCGGDCTGTGQTCGGGGTPYVCGCAPAATCPSGQTCGTAPDGCGGTLSCGTCTDPSSTCTGTPPTCTVSNPCAGNPCGSNETCTASGSGYSCACLAGYSGAPQINGPAGCRTLVFQVPITYAPIAGFPDGDAFTVELVDASNNLFGLNGDSVVLSVSAPSGATVTGTLSQGTAAGVATFSGLTFSLPGQYTLTAIDSYGATTTATASVTVLAACPANIDATYTVIDLGPNPGGSSGGPPSGVSGTNFTGSANVASLDPTDNVDAYYTTYTGSELQTVLVANPGANGVAISGQHVAGNVSGNPGQCGAQGNSNAQTVAFFWDGALTCLGVLPTGNSSFAVAISGDSVAGNSYLGPDPQNPNTHAFLWTSATGMRDLGALSSGASSSIAISGTNVAGNSGPPHGLQHAFLWTSGSGMQDLGTLGGAWSNAYAIDGTNETGDSYTGGISHAFLSINGGPMTDLTFGSGYNSRGLAIWGTNVTGYFTGNGNSNPFLSIDGAQQGSSSFFDLGSFGGNGEGLAIYGERVTGYSDTGRAGTGHAFVWRNGCMIDINPAGWSSSQGAWIDANGDVSGYGQVPDPSTGQPEYHFFYATPVE